MCSFSFYQLNSQRVSVHSCRELCPLNEYACHVGGACGARVRVRARVEQTSGRQLRARRVRRQCLSSYYHHCVFFNELLVNQNKIYFFLLSQNKCLGRNDKVVHQQDVLSQIHS
jgi:hypothetical protein